MNEPFPHCPGCGRRFPPDETWPRRCADCGRTSHLNPLPVAVVLLPVDDGVLLVRRTIDPGRGELALPGGYVSTGETWQAGAARELLEESGIEIDPAELEVFRVASTPDDQILIFAVAPARDASDLPGFVANDEAAERVVVSSPVALAFDHHTRVLEDWFASRKTRPRRRKRAT